MNYWRSVIIGAVIILCLLVCSVFVFLWSKDSCPLGTFTCTTGGICVPQRSVCNNYNDCANGDDEDPVLCSDINGSVNMINQISNTSYTDIHVSRKMLDVCKIKNYPSECLCKYFFRMFCKNIGLTSVPQDISKNITHLILANNSIHFLDRYSFTKYNLQVIHLEGNELINLPSGVFKEQKNLKRLLLMYNNLTYIQEGVFSGLHQLLWLFLDNNFIKDIHIENFKDLISLEWLNLSNNQLKLDGYIFPPMPKLLEAFFDNNIITKVSKTTFFQLKNLELLGLRRNKITYIDSKAFANLKNLRELDLFENQLTNLSPDVFNSLALLSKMYLGHNPFEHIPSQLFFKLRNLASLNMENIEIENIDVRMFSHLKNLESVYFKKYNYCAYAPTVPRCRPLSDGISSTRQLLTKPVLRYVTWIISLGTCTGNALVLWGRFILRDENKVLSIVIRNLAVSDMLMGIYLLVIGIHDIKYRDVYNSEAYKWMSSWTCTFTGMLAMISSEVSVLLLVFMSVDRFLLIAVPFGRYSSITMKETVLILICIWLVGIGIAIVPAIEFFSSTRFYGVNGLCFPLHIDDPFLLGWEFSAIIFFGINATSLILIGTVYFGMFVSICKTRNATSLPVKDYEFAIRFFFIVVVDTSCWLPIILVKLLAYSGTEISMDLYAWLVVFVLPINSALNPLLYTFTTPKYRTKMYRATVPDCVQDNVKEEVKTTRRQSPHSTADTGSIPLTSRSAQSLNLKIIINKF